MIFSLDGIFKIYNNSKTIHKFIYKDNSNKQVIVDDYELLEDNSEYNYTEMYQISPQHFSKKIRQETYMLRENGLLKFIVLKDDINNDIIDFYFDTNESIHNEFIKHDISYFLSHKEIV